MKINSTYRTVIVLAITFMIAGCSMTYKTKKRGDTANLALAKPKVVERPKEKEQHTDQVTEFDNKGQKGYIVDAIQEDGESMATMDIEQISVVTTTKTVAERKGEITVDFMISIPSVLQSRNWGLYFTPVLSRDGEISQLDKIVIRGEVFSDLQKRQYWQFDKYLNRISDRIGYCENSSALLSKYYEVRNDIAQRKRPTIDKVYKETVKFPYVTDSRLDSVIHRGGETFNYYYTQAIKTTAGLRKLQLSFDGEIRAIDNSSIKLPVSDTLSYIITSMVSLVDDRPIYVKKIVDKYVSVNDKYMVTFPAGRAQVVDTMGANRSEIQKMEKMFNSLVYNYEFFIDSIVLTATGSPDGSYRLNSTLAKNRASAMQTYLAKKIGAQIDTLIKIRSIAEDWDELKRLVMRDTVISSKRDILEMIAKEPDLDRREQKIAKTYPKEYAYIKKTLYPALRSVNFKYALRRVGMVKDTVHTTALDSVYLVGVQHLKDREYVKALAILEPYKNHNTAIVLLSLGYDRAAYDVLVNISNRSARENYLLAIACARVGKADDGRKYFAAACESDPVLKFRANLDPEIQMLLNNRL